MTLADKLLNEHKILYNLYLAINSKTVADCSPNDLSSFGKILFDKGCLMGGVAQPLTCEILEKYNFIGYSSKFRGVFSNDYRDLLLENVRKLPLNTIYDVKMIWQLLGKYYNLFTVARDMVE